jgi:hypothetical protein
MDDWELQAKHTHVSRDFIFTVELRILQCFKTELHIPQGKGVVVSRASATTKVFRLTL